MSASELVLLYHGIGEPPAHLPADEPPYWIEPAAFAAQMRALPGAARQAGVEPLVTFDDGNLSDLTIAAPLLRELGLRGIFFVCAGRLGKPGYLDAAGLRALHEMGFEIGTHGMDHLPWPRQDDAGLVREIDTARQVLQQALGQPIRRAALPFGAYDRRVLAASRRAGFDTVYSADPGLSTPGEWLPRRWCWVQGQSFEVAGLVAAYRSPAFRLVTGLKRQIKSWR